MLDQRCRTSEKSCLATVVLEVNFYLTFSLSSLCKYVGASEGGPMNIMSALFSVINCEY